MNEKRFELMYNPSLLPLAIKADHSKAEEFKGVLGPECRSRMR
jgi:hypothetical protein